MLKGNKKNIQSQEAKKHQNQIRILKLSDGELIKTMINMLRNLMAKVDNIQDGNVSREIETNRIETNNRNEKCF